MSEELKTNDPLSDCGCESKRVVQSEYDRNMEVDLLVKRILKDYEGGRDIDKTDFYDRPGREAVHNITDNLIRIVFPGFYRDKTFKSYNAYGNLTVLIEDVIYNLSKQIAKVMKYISDGKDLDEKMLQSQAHCMAVTFCNRIPNVRAVLNTDLEATYDGDPAAYNKDEIVLSYPGLLATTVNRLAHELFLLKIPLIPRIMTEYAHSRTGIDIHPAATIGSYFFIDHGTGIVVGSTTEIGNHVKIYQGVTLGALSTSEGHALHGIKRHPTIKDNVTIYSGASILGGDTVIVENSVIGSNVFITHSIPPDTRVTIKNQEQTYRAKDGSMIFRDNK